MPNPSDRPIPHQADRIVGLNLDSYANGVLMMPGVSHSQVMDARFVAETPDQFASSLSGIAFRSLNTILRGNAAVNVEPVDIVDRVPLPSLWQVISNLPRLKDAPITRPIDGPAEAPRGLFASGLYWVGKWNWHNPR